MCGKVTGRAKDRKFLHCSHGRERVPSAQTRACPRPDGSGPTDGGNVERGIVALVSFGAAFAMSWLVQPHFRNLGFLTKIVDYPGGRRPHLETVPRTGGLAIFISFFCSLYFLETTVLKTALPWPWLGILGGAGLVILALGVGDDRFGIHAEKKLYGQLVVILGLMLAGQRLDLVIAAHRRHLQPRRLVVAVHAALVSRLHQLDEPHRRPRRPRERHRRAGLALPGRRRPVPGQRLPAAAGLLARGRDHGLPLLEYQQPQDLPRRLGQHVAGPGAGHADAAHEPGFRRAADDAAGPDGGARSGTPPPPSCAAAATGPRSSWRTTITCITGWCASASRRRAR